MGKLSTTVYLGLCIAVSSVSCVTPPAQQKAMPGEVPKWLYYALYEGQEALDRGEYNHFAITSSSKPVPDDVVPNSVSYEECATSVIPAQAVDQNLFVRLLQVCERRHPDVE